ncbi:hypothetical protein [Luteimonas sp. e5]
MPGPAPRLLLAVLTCLLVLAGCGQPPELPDVQIAGLVTDQELDEISGIAASRRAPDLLWAIQDSGNPARLYALSRRGRVLGTFDIEGAINQDWEDIASFELDGEPWLLIADTGDNGGIRKTLHLHFLREPEDVGAGGVLRPERSIEFRWPDGARDCEAVAVDAVRDEILLISKKRQPPQLFILPLRPRADAPRTLTARLAGTLVGVPQASAAERRDNPQMARLRSQVTAADIAPERDAIAVLTYDNLLVYRRDAELDWPRALASPPLVVRLHLLPQPEAVAWSHGGHGIFASGEFSPAPILYLPYVR